MDRGIEVGCLIDAEPLDKLQSHMILILMKTQDLGEREEVLRHDQNAHDRMKRYHVLCCLILLPSLQKNLLARYTGRFYRQNLLCIRYFQSTG